MLEEYRAYLEDIHKCLGRAGVHLDLDFTGSIDNLYQSVDVLEQYLFYNKMLQISDSGYKISILDYDDQVLFTDLLKRSFKEEFRVRLEKEQEQELETPPDPLASGGVVRPMSLDLSTNSDFEESEVDLSSGLTDETASVAEQDEEEQKMALSASQQFMQQFNLIHRADDESEEDVSSNSGIHIEDEPVIESNFVDFEEEAEEEEAEDEDEAWAEQSSDTSDDFEKEDDEDNSPFVDFESEDDEDEDDWDEEESEADEVDALDEPDDNWEQEEEVSSEGYDSDEEDDDDWGDNSDSDEDSSEPIEEVSEEDDDDDWSSEDEENSGTFADEDDEDDWDNSETFENSSEESSSDSGSLNLVSADESVDDTDAFDEDSDYDEFGYEDYSDEGEFEVSGADGTDSFESSDEDDDDEEDWGSDTDSEDEDEFGADSDDDGFGADVEDSEEDEEEEEFGADPEPSSEPETVEDEDDYDYDAEEEDWGDPINSVNSLAPDPAGSDYFTFDKPIGGVEPPAPAQQSAINQASEQASGMQQDSFVSVSDAVQSMAEGIVGAVGKLFGRTSRHKDSQNNSK